SGVGRGPGSDSSCRDPPRPSAVCGPEPRAFEGADQRAPPPGTGPVDESPAITPTRRDGSEGLTGAAARARRVRRSGHLAGCFAESAELLRSDDGVRHALPLTHGSARVPPVRSRQTDPAPVPYRRLPVGPIPGANFIRSPERVSCHRTLLA